MGGVVIGPALLSLRGLGGAPGMGWIWLGGRASPSWPATGSCTSGGRICAEEGIRMGGRTLLMTCEYKGLYGGCGSCFC